MYATHPPCPDCARAIIQSGITKVYTQALNEDNPPTGTWRDSLTSSQSMLRESGVELLYLSR